MASRYGACPPSPQSAQFIVTVTVTVTVTEGGGGADIVGNISRDVYYTLVLRRSRWCIRQIYLRCGALGNEKALYNLTITAFEELQTTSGTISSRTLFTITAAAMLFASTFARCVGDVGRRK